MFSRIKQLLTPTIAYRIVEITAPRQTSGWDAGSAEAVATLQGHPGFQYLLNKLRVQRAALQSALANQRQKSLTDVEFLQSGIAWAGWLEGQLQQALGFKSRPAPVAPFDEEERAFQEVAKFVEAVGE